MKLRSKTLLVFSFTLFFLVLTLYISAGSIIFQSFEDLERKDVSDDMDKALDFFDQLKFTREIIVQNWATGSDTNEFILDNNPVYIESNLANDNFKELNLNIIIFQDASGEIIYKKAYDQYTDEEIPFPHDLIDILSEDNPMVPSSDNNYAASGLVMLSEGPMIFASRLIKESPTNNTFKGTVIAGTFFDSGMVTYFSDVHKIPLNYYLLQGSELDPEIGHVIGSIEGSKESVYIQPASEHSIMGYNVLDDVYGEPALLLEISTPRIIYQKARTTFAYFLYIIIFIGFLYGVVSTVFLENSILSRVSFLTRDVDAAKKDYSSSSKISVSGNDEIASLGSSINHLMERLDERENLLSSIIESSSEGVIVIDENYMITHFNSKFIRIWDIPEQILIEKNGLKLIDHLKDRMVDHEDMLTRLRKNHMSAKRTFSIAEFRDNTYFEVSSFPLMQDEQVLGRILSFRDISERKMAEDFLQEKDHRYRC